MSYNANIPLSTDKVSNSQAAILSNFQALNAYFGRNHTPFANNTTALNGKHSFVEMVSTISKPAPVPGLAAGTGTIYTKIASSISDLFFIHDNTINEEYQITNVAKNGADFGFLAKDITATVSGGVGTTGWVWLGQSMILQYGTVPHTNSGSKVIKFQLPFTGNPFMIQTTGIITGSDPNGRGNCPIQDGSISNMGFTILTTTSTDLKGTYWMAIGIY